MIPFFFDYATPSAFESDRDRARLGLAANARRPVRFHGRVARDTFLLRIALRALGEAIWSEDAWLGGDELSAILDPVVTVHPDRIFFEAFSQDQSVYAVVVADRSLFATEGEVRTGTTNVDFTAWLWAALGELRSSRETWLRVEAGGVELRTRGAGGRFEQKVDLPESWVRGFLQLQAAMAMPGTHLRVRPVDLLSALRFLRYSKARISPRALRYELEPGQDARIVLEPWEHVVPLRGAIHGRDERRIIRTWGRRRLKLIAPLLPFAERVDVYLKGRALPSFYAVTLGEGLTFLLGLTGWSGQRFTDSASFDLLAPAGGEAEAEVARARELLAGRFHASHEELATGLGCSRDQAARLAAALCRRGLATYDVERRELRHRELFEAPIDEARLYPPDPRRERARAHLAAGRVEVREVSVSETRKTRRLPSPDGEVIRELVFRDHRVVGAVAEQTCVELTISSEGRIIFGRCGCPFFDQNLLNRGPCEHMVALLEASEAERRDAPVSGQAGTPTEPPRSVGGAELDPEGDDG